MATTVRVRLNGDLRELPAGSTLADLLGEPRPGFAAAVNGEVVPRGEWARRALADGDSVEFVRAMQGG